MADRLFEIIENASPRDKLLAYLQSSRKGDIYLSATEEEYMEQLDYADDLIRQHPTAKERELQNMIVERYAVSLSKARNLLHDARYVHGSMAKPVKAYERHLLSDFLKGIMHSSKAKGEFKIAIAAAELYAKINNLDAPDEETPAEQGGTVIIRPAFTPESLGTPLPDNIDELVANLRRKTTHHQNILNAG